MTTEHSAYFDIIKKFYDKGTWSIDRVWEAVGDGWITEDEYYEITGFVYPAKA